MTDWRKKLPKLRREGLTVAAKKKKKVVCRKKPRRHRRRSGSEFAERIRSLLDLVEAQYESETPQAAYYSAVTVVAGAFVWAMKRGCPPQQLKA